MEGSTATPNLTNTISSSPTTTIQNQNDKEFALAILRPIPFDIFKYYWDSGWPKEVLLYMFVSAITDPDDTSTSDDGEHYGNTGKYISQCKTDDLIKNNKNYRFIEKVRELISQDHIELDRHKDDTKCDPISQDLKAASAAKLEQYYNLGKLLDDCGETVRIEDNKLCVEQSRSQTADLSFQQNKNEDNGMMEKRYQLELRSWQDMVYYLGTFARVDESGPARFVNAPNNKLRRLQKTQSKLQKIRKKYEYLFRVTKLKACGSNYAAKARYNGETYYAGPAVFGFYRKDNEEFDAARNGGNGCNKGEGGGDRTGTVLTLLNETRMLSLSSEGLNSAQPVTIVGGTSQN